MPKERIKTHLILSEFKVESVCSRRFTETNSEEQQLHNHNEDDRFLPERNNVFVTEDIVKESLTSIISFPFRILSKQESKYPHNSLFSCSCYHFVTITVCRQTDARFIHSKCHTQIQNFHVPLYRLILSFISSNKVAFFRISTKMPPDGLLIIVVQHLEVNFIRHTYENSFIM